MDVFDGNRGGDDGEDVAARAEKSWENGVWGKREVLKVVGVRN